MINLDSTYLTELKRKLEHEQWSSTAAKKLQEAEFADLIQCALYFLEKDDKIIVLDDKELDAMLHQIMLIHDAMKMEREKKRQQNESLRDITGV